MPTPPAAWADYVHAVRKADAIEDREARCKALPDLPDNQWRTRSAQARCSLLRPPRWSLDELEALLASADGAKEVDRRFAALLAAHYNDQNEREQIFAAYVVFDKSEHARRVAEQWLKQSPESAFANTALGSHFADAGWDARGGEFVRKTPKANLDRMSGLFAKAVPLLAKGLDREPKLSVACVELARMGRMSSDALQSAALGHCLATDPDSYKVIYEQLRGTEPRWGGSDEAMRHAVAYAAARTERNPILGALLGEAVGYHPMLADDVKTEINILVAASKMAPSGTIMSFAGRAYWFMDKPWDTFVYMSQALRFWPHNDYYRFVRGRVLLDDLDDPVWAKSDLAAAVAADPNDGKYHYALGRAVLEVDGQTAARPHFKRAMDFSDVRNNAMDMYCQTFFLPVLEPATAEACTADLVKEFPLGGEGWRLRAWILGETGQMGAVEAAEKFIQYANMDSEFHQREVARMKKVLEQLPASVK